eukprot:TRINITY_DN12368_c0_g1_i1.p1 TRINITY_DN12368_c0_g1~~TRINITY_DN12368_c0_g1_i1.p1  ORF type:complete len:257 (-),score=41.66 TRINITY_DN12368_c0_g1_i1:145-915(-)
MESGPSKNGAVMFKRFHNFAFRQIFKDYNIASTEEVIESYCCSLAQQSGRVYITRNFLGFHSWLFKDQVKRLFSWADVESVTTKSDEVTGPYIEIQLSTGRSIERLTSFADISPASSYITKTYLTYLDNSNKSTSNSTASVSSSIPQPQPPSPQTSPVKENNINVRNPTPEPVKEAPQLPVSPIISQPIPTTPPTMSQALAKSDGGNSASLRRKDEKDVKGDSNPAAGGSDVLFWTTLAITAVVVVAVAYNRYSRN